MSEANLVSSVEVHIYLKGFELPNRDEDLEWICLTPNILDIDKERDLSVISSTETNGDVQILIEDRDNDMGIWIRKSLKNNEVGQITNDLNRPGDIEIAIKDFETGIGAKSFKSLRAFDEAKISINLNGKRDRMVGISVEEDVCVDNVRFNEGYTLNFIKKQKTEPLEIDSINVLKF